MHISDDSGCVLCAVIWSVLILSVESESVLSSID